MARRTDVEGAMIVVVRNSRTSPDPTYRCASRSATAKYATVRTDAKGCVVSRKKFADAESVYGYIRGRAETVYLDQRRAGDLEPALSIEGAYDATAVLDGMRRTKTESDRASIERLHSKTVDFLRRHPSEAGFRGAAAESGLEALVEVHDTPHFSQRRVGMQNAKGLFSDLCDATGKTAVWRKHIDDAKRCIGALKSDIKIGARFADLEASFRGSMAERGLRVTAPALRGIGYARAEPLPEDGAVQAGDAYTITAQFQVASIEEPCTIRTLALPSDSISSSPEVSPAVYRGTVVDGDTRGPYGVGDDDRINQGVERVLGSGALPADGSRRADDPRLHPPPSASTAGAQVAQKKGLWKLWGASKTPTPKR